MSGDRAGSAGRYLVTGASGFLGRHVLAQIEHAGGATVALVRDEESFRALDFVRALDDPPTCVCGDLFARAVLEPAALRDGGLRAIVHLAAQVAHTRRRSAELLRTNVEGACEMVRLAAHAKCRLVFVSTSGTVACARHPGVPAPDEEAAYCDSTVARWPYYASKIAAERQARALASELGVELVILRPPVLLGPGDHRGRSTGNVTRFLSGRLPFLIEGGIAFCDVRDVARAAVRAATIPNPRSVYHLPGTACSVVAFFERVRACVDAADAPPLPRTLPYAFAHGLASLLERAGWWLRREPFHLLPDPVVIEMAAHHWDLGSRYAHELDYVARPADETLRDTVHWLLRDAPDRKAPALP